MGSSPAPFSDIGKKAKDLLNKDYNFEHKFTLSVPSATGLGLTATGLKKDEIFVGDINSVYKSGNTIVDVKVDTYSNVSTTVTVADILPSTKATLSFRIPDHKSGKVSTKVTMVDILPSTKATLSFRIPDHKSGKLDVQYIHPHAAINTSIGLNPTPLLELSATIGSKELVLGGEVRFDTASASYTEYTAGIGLNKPDFSAALLLANKGKALKVSYIHAVDPFTSVAAEMTHRFSTYRNSFTIGSSHLIDPLTVVKTRLSDGGKFGVQFQREWRPKSLVTVSAEYNSKAIKSAPKLGIAIALKP